jgi:hypothetical protein
MSLTTPQIHETTFIRYEASGKKIPNDKLEKIAKALGVAVADLYEYKRNPGLLEQPLETYKRRKEVSVTIHLDGSPSTLDEWIATLRRLNKALE